jgi:hypothetical protein
MTSASRTAGADALSRTPGRNDLRTTLVDEVGPPPASACDPMAPVVRRRGKPKPQWARSQNKEAYRKLLFGFVTDL